METYEPIPKNPAIPKDSCPVLSIISQLTANVMFRRIVIVTERKYAPE